MDVERHLTEGVGRATEARVEGADDGFDAVQHAVFELVTLDVTLRGLQNAAVT